MIMMSVWRRRIAFSLLWMACTIGIIGVALADVGYYYDEAGRLTGVVDPSGASAQYTYDAVGNIISIGRNAAGAVSIMEFAPNSGPVGTNVTIYGTGFSTTPSQNAVTFNGVAAPVTSATATQIITQVPAGATTGPIGVTTPNGSAMSSTPFTVGASQTPTITGFTPAFGIAGTAVTLSGTNFMPQLVNNKVTFNNHYAVVNSATSTSIGAVVPSFTASGRIAVVTPYGKAVSSSDFFIPPAPYTAADVEVTGRMAIGESRTVTISTSGKIGMILFDGTAGQRVSLLKSGSTFGSCLYGTLRVLNTDSTLLGNQTNLCNSFFDTVTLPASGTYTIVIDPSAANTGQITLTLYEVPPDATGTITINGPPATVTTTVPGQNANVTFSGTQGQRISLLKSSSTFGSCLYGTLRILNPDGTLLGNQTNLCNSFFDTVTLPASGTYTIVIDPSSNSTGQITLTLYEVPPDATGTVTINGQAVMVTTTVPGQNANVTFDGMAGQQATVRITSNTMGTVTVKLLKPDGSQGVSRILCKRGFG